MADIGPDATGSNVPKDQSRKELAERLAKIRAEIRALMAEPYRYGRFGQHRRRRDEFLLQVFAADIHARLVEARAT